MVVLIDPAPIDVATPTGGATRRLRRSLGGATSLPDLNAWTTVGDPTERLRRALRELYAFYGDAEPMLSNLLRDVTLVEPVRQQFAAVEEYMKQAHATLLNGWGSPSRETAAAVGHALSFSTWRSLVRQQGCTTEEAEREIWSDETSGHVIERASSAERRFELIARHARGLRPRAGIRRIRVSRRACRSTSGQPVP